MSAKIKSPSAKEISDFANRHGLPLCESRKRVMNHRALTLSCSIDTDSENIKATLADLKELIEYLLLGELS